MAVSGVFGKTAGKICPDREMLQIVGFRAPGKAKLPEPWVDTPGVPRR